jgi:hypothetical protein
MPRKVALHRFGGEKACGYGARAASLLELDDGLVTQSLTCLVRFDRGAPGQARQQLGGELLQARWSALVKVTPG